MAWTEFYIQTTGSNLNAGSTNANLAAYTSTGGNWDGTSVFTPTDGQTTSSLVSVGDWVNVYNTGDTNPRYVAQVTAVGAGTNGTITVSTTMKFGTAPTSNSGSRNVKAGGAWADIVAPAALNVTVPTSTRINIKAGTYANTTNNRTLAWSGTATLGAWFRGYKTTLGDQDANNTALEGVDIPLITFGAARLVLSGSKCKYSNISVSGADVTANAQVVVNAPGNTFYRFRATNTAANANSKAITAISAAGTGCTAVGCYFTATTTASAVVSLAAVNATLIGCVITGGAGGIAISSGPISLLYCVIDSPQGDAVNIGGQNLYMANCSIYAPTGNGVNFTALSSLGSVISNCYFENVNQAAKAAISNTSGTNTDVIQCVANSYYNCTANLSGLTESFAVFDQGSLGSAGFVLPGSQNFALNSVAKALGFPGLFENTSVYQGYLDPGAVQRQEPAGGGGPPATRVCVFEFPPSVICE